MLRSVNSGIDQNKIEAAICACGFEGQKIISLSNVSLYSGNILFSAIRSGCIPGGHNVDLQRSKVLNNC